MSRPIDAWELLQKRFTAKEKGGLGLDLEVVTVSDILTAPTIETKSSDSSLKDISTKELVDELLTREEIEHKWVSTYSDKTITVDRPTLLIIDKLKQNEG